MRTIRAAAISGALLCICNGSLARGGPVDRHDFDIEMQPVDGALFAFSKQSGLQILYSDDHESGDKQVLLQGVKGQLSAGEALDRLLPRREWSYQFINARTVGIAKLRSVDDNQERRTLNTGGAASETGTRSQNSTHETDSSASSARPPLQEVVVTAQKREEPLQDVPISISVLSGADLDRSTTQGVTEALNRVPGVSAIVSGLGGGGTRINVRGVGPGGSIVGGSSPVSYYLDSVPFSLVKTPITPDANTYDLDRVEVLRGPQGTLYGSNAQAGVVRVLTHDADLDKFEFKMRGSISNTNSASENYRGDLAINAPVIEGKLGFRAVVGYQDLSGWITRATGTKDINDQQVRTARFKLNAQPSEQLSVGLSAALSRTDADGLNYANEPSLVPEPYSVDHDAYGLKVGYDFAGASISSQTSYLDYDNAGYVDLGGGSSTGPGDTLFTGINAHAFSQEFLLTSSTEGQWRWSIGAAYRDGKDRFRQSIPAIPLGGNPPEFLDIEFDWTNSSKSYAGFGELSQRFLNDQLQWTLGLRYYHDEIRMDENFLAPADTLLHTKKTFNATTPRLVLTWFPEDNLTAYVSYSEGFRSGFGQNPNVLRGNPDFVVVKPDTLHNYELGWKSDLFERRLSLNAAVFYMDWKDIMQSLRVPLFAGSPSGVTAIVNSKSASGLGAEFAAVFRPARAVEFGASFSWNDLTLDAPVVTGSATQAVLFDKGDRINLSPKYTAGLFADYVVPLGARLEGRFSASANYTSQQVVRSVDLSQTPPTRITSVGDSILISRASFSVQDSDHWSATLFADNLNNEDGNVTLGEDGAGLRVRPRTIGVQLEYNY